MYIVCQKRTRGQHKLKLISDGEHSERGNGSDQSSEIGKCI